MLEKWDKSWLNILYVVGIVLLMILVAAGSNWSTRFRLIWTVAIILPIHACEEWQLPGGFHYQYNLTFGSNDPNRYPMNRITDMLTVCIAEIVYLGCLFFAQNTWIVMALCGFCLLEVGMHTFFGVTMYRRFKDRGKKTIYNPGFASAYLGFGVIAIMMIQNVIASGVTGYDWVKTIIMLILMGLIEILLPERLFRNHNTSYGYASAKYFTKFLK